jgi:hypothetical protein
MRRVWVHIDSLVFRGFRYEDRHAIAAGLQETLARVLAKPAVASKMAASGDVAHVSLGTIPNGNPQQVGGGIARGFGKRIGS